MKKNIYSGLFVLTFVMPQTLLSTFPKSWQYPALIAFSILLLFFIYQTKDIILNKRFSNARQLAYSFVFFGLVTFLVHSRLNLFNIIGPLFGFIGYVYIANHKIKSSIVFYFMIVLYVYFYYVYFSVLPDLFYRPYFDEDAIVFEISSSNAIPISLNITLFIYMIISKIQYEKNENKIMLLSTVNLISCIIQQSRVGVIISLIIWFFALNDYYKKSYVSKIVKVLRINKNVMFYAFTSVLIFFIVYLFSPRIAEYNNIIGIEEDYSNTYNKDARGVIVYNFFNRMDLFEFVFGHREKMYGKEYAKNSDKVVNNNYGYGYTQNMFLDIWDRYGFVQFVLFCSLLMKILYRRLMSKEFLFPSYFFIPFIVYAFFESLFFPNFWDWCIYVLIFASEKNSPLALPPTVLVQGS